jgi:hypothetical protein
VEQPARTANDTRPVGKHYGLGKQLADIQAKAAALRDKAAKGTGS